jgi:hypothetical protein
MEALNKEIKEKGYDRDSFSQKDIETEIERRMKIENQCQFCERVAHKMA